MAAVHLPAAAQRRRPTGFSAFHWLAFGATVAVLLCLDATGIWAGIAGPAGGALPAWLAQHLKAIVIVLAALGAAVGALNAWLMRMAVLSDDHLSLETYRRVRQTHRYLGYTAALIGVSVVVLSCVHAFRLSGVSWTGVATAVLGALLLIVAAAKIAVVRGIPSLGQYLNDQPVPALALPSGIPFLRQYLMWFGLTLLALLAGLFILTLLS